MKRVRYYDASHPMLVARSGDPARGDFTPRDKRKAPRKGRKPRR